MPLRSLRASNFTLLPESCCKFSAALSVGMPGKLAKMHLGPRGFSLRRHSARAAWSYCRRSLAAPASGPLRLPTASFRSPHRASAMIQGGEGIPQRRLLENQKEKRTKNIQKPYRKAFRSSNGPPAYSSGSVPHLSGRCCSPPRLATIAPKTIQNTPYP